MGWVWGEWCGLLFGVWFCFGMALINGVICLFRDVLYCFGLGRVACCYVLK